MPRGIPNVAAVEVVAAPVVAVSAGRFEKFEAVRPDGTVVVVTRNIDTGEQTVSEK